MNKQDLTRNYPMLKGPLARRGYDWWWHSFTAQDAETGESKAFFLEYFICNPALGGKEAVLGQHPDSVAKGKRPSYLMVKAGWWGEDAGQIHRFIPWDQVRLSQGPAGFRVEGEDCFCTETAMAGQVEVKDAEQHREYLCDNGCLQWEIQIHKEIAFHVGYGASKFFRKLNAFEMFWHVQGMKTAYSGWLLLNGRRYVVKPETCYGYADKNWGGDFTSPWVWLSSCHLTSKRTGKPLTNSAFVIGGGRPKVFGVALNRKLLSSFFYEGKDYEFNFSKFWTFTRTKFSCRETETEILWYVRQETLKAVMETCVACPKEEMLLIQYEAPNGKKLHNRLWNGGTGKGTVKLWKKEAAGLQLIDEVLAENVGCEYGEYDHC